jgi:preprotein translocase subunit SecE
LPRRGKAQAADSLGARRSWCRSGCGPPSRFCAAKPPSVWIVGAVGIGGKIFFVNNWLQIIVVAVVIGAAFGYLWYQGQIKAFAGYCQETWVELQKCTWPTWEELKGSTALIMVMIALLGGFIVVIDLILTQVFFHK